MAHLSGDIISLFNRGDQPAFAALYDRFQPAIFYFVKRFIPDIQQAEDITAETFVKLWNKRTDFDNERSIASFLHVTAKNASIDWLRATKREMNNKAELIHLLSQDKVEDLHEDIRAELMRLIQAEIDQLPRVMRKVFLMAYAEGKTNEEIAQALQINNQSVRNHKARALKLLRLALSGRNWLFVILAFLYKRF
jgi:RNA polymerase sigma-70 factor (family 1)